MSKSGNKFLDEYLEIMEREVLPALEDVKHELEKDGWYCFIGDLKSSYKIKGTKKQMPEMNCLTSLSIMDIENGIVQHVFVFLDDGKVRFTSDVLKENNDFSLALTEISRQSVKATINIVINSQ
jgi:hypothetical protein